VQLLVKLREQVLVFSKPAPYAPPILRGKNLLPLRTFTLLAVWLFGGLWQGDYGYG
jgi:hypothetical protein